MSLAAYYGSCAIPKTFRAVEKLKADREADRKERACRVKVNRRDGHRCFFPQCKTRSSDKHHVRPRSLMGEWISSNILSACRKHHDWFKAGLILTKGNPDHGHVEVLLTPLGEKAAIRIPSRHGGLAAKGDD